MLQFLTCEIAKGLKFLTENEMEVASAFVTLHTVEAVGPVDTHHTHHRQINAHTQAGATFEAEGVELADRCPSVTAFHKGYGVDGGSGLEHQREVEFHS